VVEEKKEKRPSTIHGHNASVGVGLGLTPGTIASSGSSSSSGDRDEKRGMSISGNSGVVGHEKKEQKYDHLYDGHEMD
jgi:hypothetical protein